MKEIVVIAHDMRSTYNVGSLFRTCEAMAVSKLWLTGYTAYPLKNADDRLPHISEKLDNQINKTALGSTKLLDWDYQEDIFHLIHELQAEGFTVVGLEQSENSTNLTTYKSPNKIALILGTELTGIPEKVLRAVDEHIEIPMLGKKESLNVVQAAAMALYHLRFKAD